MVKEIFLLEVALDFRYSKPKYRVYATGENDYHIMDWSGCNYERCPVPDATFNTYAEAAAFIEENDDRFTGGDRHTNYIDASGQHLGVLGDLWKLKVVTREIDQEEYEFRKKTFSDNKKNRYWKMSWEIEMRLK